VLFRSVLSGCEKMVRLAVITLCIALAVAAPLSGYNVFMNTTSVGGLSSGAYFAVQMQVAFSSFIMGAAIFAGGPYHCAEGNENTALTTCMSALPTPPNPSTYVTVTKNRATQGVIDSTDGMAKQKVYLYSGTQDTTVKPAVMNALNTYFQSFISTSNINYENQIKSAHTQPTVDKAENPCTLSITPYISYCDYDGAGLAFTQIYGKLNGRNNGTLTGKLLQFDQSAYYTNPKSISMDNTGYVFVPQACANGDPCKLHVSFHGCAQYAGTVGTQYVTNAGYNYWADTNNIIVLYPQTVASTLNPSNPNGCWDWWGYNAGAATNYDTKSGAQMATIQKMIQAIAQGK